MLTDKPVVNNRHPKYTKVYSKSNLLKGKLIIPLLIGLFFWSSWQTTFGKENLTSNNWQTIKSEKLAAAIKVPHSNIIKDREKHIVTMPIFSGENDADKITNAVKTATNIAQRVVVPIFVIAIIIIGYRMVTALDEEKAKEQRKRLFVTVTGLIIITLAIPIVNIVYQLEAGKTPLWSGKDTLSTLANEVGGLYNFLAYLLAGVAVIVIIFNGFLMFFAGGDEREFKKYRNAVVYAGIGMMIITLSSVIVQIMYGGMDLLKTNNKASQIGPDLSKGITEAVGLLNYALSFLATVAVTMIIYAGYLWLTAGSNDEQTKKASQIIIGAITGIIIIISSYIIVGSFY